MRARAFFVMAAALAAFAVMAAAAIAGSGTDRTTGGGQVLFSSRGPGNTIAWQAQGNSNTARGQVQVIDRSGGEKFHGTVDCLNVQGNMAAVYGHRTDRDGGAPFELYIVDNGQGAASNDDIVALTSHNPSGNCSNPDDSFDDSDALAPGHARVYAADQQP